MSDNTGIEWADATWNPVIGCAKVSPGCDRCYAIRTAHRMQAHPNPKVSVPYAGTESGGQWTGRVNLVADRLLMPLRWRRPRRIFVNAQSDLFHDQVPDTYIAEVFAVMAAAPRHTFQVLTKRHARMRSLLSSADWPVLLQNARDNLGSEWDAAWDDYPVPADFASVLPNVWLGVSTENQQWADIRIPALLDTPAAVRWISAEPLLGPITLRHMDIDLRDFYQIDALTGRNTDMGRPCADVASLDWVVAGGESGPGARPMHPDWVRGLRDQCAAAGVPFLFKQWGAWAPEQGLNYPEGNGRRLHYARTYLRPDGTAAVFGDGAGPGTCLERVGKKAAGRHLDGRIWDQYPEAVSVR